MLVLLMLGNVTDPAFPLGRIPVLMLMSLPNETLMKPSQPLLMIIDLLPII